MLKTLTFERMKSVCLNYLLNKLPKKKQTLNTSALICSSRPNTLFQPITGPIQMAVCLNKKNSKTVLKQFLKQIPYMEKKTICFKFTFDVQFFQKI